MVVAFSSLHPPWPLHHLWMRPPPPKPSNPIMKGMRGDAQQDALMALALVQATSLLCSLLPDQPGKPVARSTRVIDPHMHTHTHHTHAHIHHTSHAHTSRDRDPNIMSRSDHSVLLSQGTEMSYAIKLVDKSLHWEDRGIDVRDSTTCSAFEMVIFVCLEPCGPGRLPSCGCAGEGGSGEEHHHVSTGRHKDWSNQVSHPN